MNIYNFIYCFFYNLWKKKGGGRIDSSAHVLFSAIIHILLFAEIIRYIMGNNIYKLPDYGEYGSNKTMYFIFLVPFWIGLFFFYNTKRTKRLLKEYHSIYKDSKKNTIRILIYFILPIIAVISLAVIRQNFGNLSD